MNTLAGTIAAIATEGNLSLVRIRPTIKPSDLVSPSLSIAGVRFLFEGEVSMLFKETEVIIAKDFHGQISVQNKFGCIVKAIERGKLLAKVLFDYAGAEISSIITLNAVNTLK